MAKIRLGFPQIQLSVLEEIKNILLSGQITQGRYVEEFQDSLKDFLRRKYVICVSSGTAALHLALLALGIQPNEGVIVPDFTFPAVANVVEHIQAIPIFADVSLYSFNMEAKDASSVLSKKAKAIIIVHQFGAPVDVDAFYHLAEENGLRIIEDAACALGSTYKNKSTGSFGDISCLSFHPRKLITTGEGGAIATDDQQLAEKCASLTNQGIVKKDGEKFFQLAGFNYRMDEISALLGVFQLKELAQLIAKREQIAGIYNSFFKDHPGIFPQQILPQTRTNYQSYVVRIDTDVPLKEIILKLDKSGIEAVPGNYALHCQPYYQVKYNFKEEDFPVSSLLAKKTLALPMHSHLTEEQAEYVAKQLLTIVG